MQTQVELDTLFDKVISHLTDGGWKPEPKYRFYDRGRVSLLTALQHACDYNMDVYKNVIVFLASKIQTDGHTEHSNSWPICALDLAAWEACDERSLDDVKWLLR